jgi:hypothetical protein
LSGEGRERARGQTWYSSGFSLPSRALVASDLVSAEMVARPFPPTSLMMGVIRPVGVATATQMSAFLYLMDTCTNQVLCQTWTERVQKEGGRGGCRKEERRRSHCRMTSPIQAELASGTSARAREAALTTGKRQDRASQLGNH